MSIASPSREADPTSCAHQHGFDAKGSCFDCDTKIGPSIMEITDSPKCTAIVRERWHTPEHRCTHTAVLGSDRCRKHRRGTQAAGRASSGGPE
jgi:hypothetical protein